MSSVFEQFNGQKMTVSEFRKMVGDPGDGDCVSDDDFEGAEELDVYLIDDDEKAE